ncbi:MAG TPA: low molecular weight protein-tyrosine-phosphatase [Cytophagales bacterium]|jgi:protein-tyrosine phosphatase
MPTPTLNVLFVCLGNICRSPMAEGIFAHLVKEAGLHPHIACDSAGTSDYHIGELPDPRMRQTAGRYGLTLTHRARQLRAADFQQFDYILAMDEANWTDITRHPGYRPEYARKVSFLRMHDDDTRDLNVPDPYYGGPEGFERVYQLLRRTSGRFLQFLVEQHHLQPVPKPTA